MSKYAILNSYVGSKAAYVEQNKDLNDESCTDYIKTTEEVENI